MLKIRDISGKLKWILKDEDVEPKSVDNIEEVKVEEETKELTEEEEEDDVVQ